MLPSFSGRLGCIDAVPGGGQGGGGQREAKLGATGVLCARGNTSSGQLPLPLWCPTFRTSRAEPTPERGCFRGRVWPLYLHDEMRHVDMARWAGAPFTHWGRSSYTTITTSKSCPFPSSQILCLARHHRSSHTQLNSSRSLPASLPPHLLLYLLSVAFSSSAPFPLTLRSPSQ